jgi:CheY-like chemotaxis protein
MTEMRSTVVRRLSSEVKPVVRILLVDPRPQSRAILKSFLRNLSVVQAVYERSTTAELVQGLAETPVHLLILEQDLGKETGLSVIRGIQNSELARKPRFMLIAGAMSDAERREASELGVRSVLSRPYDVNSLERSVLEALGATTGDIQALRTRMEHLRRVPSFGGFSDLELARLVKLCPMIQVPTGQSIYIPGQPARSLFMVIEGQVQMYRGEPHPAVLASVMPGDCFGESAMVHPGKRRQGARAETDCWIMEVSQNVFCQEEETVVLKLVRQIALQVLLKVHALS